MADDEIQLTTVKSHASTGNRKAHMASSTSFDNGRSEKEHHHHHFRRGRRRRPDDSLGRTETGDDEGAKLNYMGRLYNKIINFSVVTRYAVYVVPVALLLAVPLIVLPLIGRKDDIFVGYKDETPEDGKDGQNGPKLFNLFLWIEITWLTVWLAKIVAWFVPRAFTFFSGIVSAGTRKYAQVLHNLNIPLSLFFWALASWLTFKNLFAPSIRADIEWTKTLQIILGALFTSSAVFLGEKAIVQLIGVTYHQRSFANRIEASKREIRLLGMLYDASRTLFPMFCPEFADEDYVINDSIELKLGGKHTRSKSGSATPMRLIGDVGRIGGKVTSAFGNIASEITGKQVFNPNSAHSIVLEALEKARTSEALARRIWMSFVVEGKEVLYPEDFNEVLGPAYKDEAEEAFSFIDNDQNGDISLDEMVRKIVEIGKERKAIAEGMKDIGQALGAFDKVLLFVVLLIVIFIFLAWFQSTFITTITTAGTALLSLSFIFAVTCQEFLGSCIFLFVKHPYDVGDRVEINGVGMIVNRISLLYTVFTRSDVSQISQIPNIQLNNYWVDNLSRSKAMSETIEVDISFDTTFEDIELLRTEMEKFVRAPENSRDFKPDFSISISSVGSLDKMTLQMSISHKSNWHDAVVKGTRRSKFLCALALAMKKVPIYGPGGGGEALGGPTNPTYSVAVSDEWASNSRNKTDADKANARMVPPPPANSEEAREHEKAAAEAMNTRPPVAEIVTSWDTRDDRTLNADQIEEAQRNRDIDSVRSSLVKRASTRGRRRAGEGLPSMTSDSAQAAAGLQPRTSTSSRHEPGFDEEAATGMPSSFYHTNRGALSPTSPTNPSGHLHPSSSVRSDYRGAPPPSSSSGQR